MTEKIRKYPYIILLLIIGAVYFFLQYISPLVSPVLLAFFLIMAVAPKVDNISRRTGMRKGFVVALLTLLLFAGLGVIVLVVCVLGGQFVPKIVTEIPLFEGQIYIFIDECCSLLENRLGIDGEYVGDYLIGQISVLVSNLQRNLVPGMISNSIGWFSNIVSVGGFLLVFFISLFLLFKDYRKIYDKLISTKEGKYILEGAGNIVQYCVGFVKAQLTILLCISVFCAITLSVFGVEKGWVWGLLAGLLDMLPFIGTGIVLVPLAVWQLINANVFGAVVCIVVYAMCAVLRELLEPKLIGKRTGIYPIFIVVSVFAGVQLFGVWGIIKGPFAVVLITQIYQMIFIAIKNQLSESKERKEEIDENCE